MSGSRAHRLIDSIDVFHNIENSPRGEFPTLPQNEKSIRPLVTPDDQRLAWSEALANLFSRARLPVYPKVCPGSFLRWYCKKGNGQ